MNTSAPHKQSGNFFVYLLMLLATIAVTLAIALSLFAAESRTRSFVLSLTMLCFAETLLFVFPIYHSRASADVKQPAFTFGFGIQTSLVIYAVGIVALCFVAGVGVVSFLILAILHALWALGLLLILSSWWLGSSSATTNVQNLNERKRKFAEVQVRVQAFAASVGRDKTAERQQFQSSVASLRDDVMYATPDTLKEAELFDAALLASLERLGADYNSARLQSQIDPAVTDDLIDKVKEMACLVRERNAAIRAAR
jgi:hypothetical protein